MLATLYARVSNFLSARGITWNKAASAGLLAPVSAAGVVVTAETALTNSPVFAAVRVISTAIASLPLCLFRKLPDGGRERADDHPVYGLVHDDPNPESTPVAFWSAFVAQMLLHGFGVAEIERRGDGSPLALWLLPSDRVDVMRDAGGGLFFRLHAPAGAVDLPPGDTFYVPYFSLDGVSGRGIIRYARDAVGLNKAMETGAGALFANMVRPGGAIEAPVGFSDQARQNLAESVKKANAGAGKVGRLMLLEEGAKFNPFTVSNDDAQWIEGRQFGVQEVARFFSISPTKLGDLGRATWSNIESENLSFIENTLRPPIIGIEQEARKKLLTPAERRALYVECVIEGRLRGLTRDRYAAFAVALGNKPFLLPSEVRGMENLAAAPELDALFLASPPVPPPPPAPAGKSPETPPADGAPADAAA